jgi:hypothetical protein
MAWTGNQLKLTLGVLTLAGVLGAAFIGRTSRAPAPSQPTSHLELKGDNNIQIAGSNNVINPVPPPKLCRLKSHGVERYDRTFEDGEESGWMGGGHSQDEWCENLQNKLNAQNPGADFAILQKSESKRDTCLPFNCPQYNYYCKVQVKADPIYIAKLDDACK